MLKVTIQQGKQLETVSLPTNWGEVLFRDRMAIGGMNQTEVLAYYLKLDTTQVVKLPDFERLCMVLSFIESKENYYTSMTFDPVRIGVEPWYKLEQCREIVREHEGDEWACMAEFVRIYCKQTVKRKWWQFWKKDELKPLDISDKPLSQAYGLAKHVHDKFADFMSNYEEMHSGHLTSKEVQAMFDPAIGMDYTEGLGFIPALDLLSNRDITKRDEVLMIPAKTVMDFLLSRNREARYARRLQDLYNQKQA